MGQPLYDVQRSFRAGQNFTDTDGSIPNAYIAGLNVRPQGDDLVPRYPIKTSKKLTFDKGTIRGKSYEFVFKHGNPQALIPYVDGDAESLIYIVNGRWFKINLKTFHVSLIPYDAHENKLSAMIQIVNHEIVEKAVTVYDGDLPLIYDGISIRRARYDATYTFTDAEKKIVVLKVPEALRSTMGAYDNLRLWLAVGSNVLAASDEFGTTPNAPLSFGQSFTDDGEFTGQFPALSSSTNFETITAMGNMVSQNPEFTGLLLVSTNEKIYVIQSNQPRTAWESTPNFIKQILNDSGIAGQLAWGNFGYDVLYIDPDGNYNSIFLNQGDLEQWADTKISTEVSNYIKSFNPSLYKYSTLVSFGSMALMTSFPYLSKRKDLDGYDISTFAFKGFVALSRENQSGLNQPARPVWAGLWTGVNPIFATKVGKKLWILSDDNGVNELYFMEDKLDHDNYKGEEIYIRSRVTFANYKFQDGGVQDKELKSVDFAMTDIDKFLKVKAEYRPSERTRWDRLGEQEFCLPPCLDYEECTNSIHDERNLDLGNFRMSVDNSACETINKFRSMDLRLTMEGMWRLKDLRINGTATGNNTGTEFNKEDLTYSGCCNEIDDYNLYKIFDKTYGEVSW